MRVPRLKAPEGEVGIYHCISNIVGGQFLLQKAEREMLVRMMWKLVDFCGVTMLSYCVMSNHYHQLVKVPASIELTDEELLGKVTRLYGEKHREVRLLTKALEEKGKKAEEARQRFLRRMGDISQFQKELKQRFSTWYNHRKQRKGTLWMERFKSLLTEEESLAVGTIAAYIDLNPVRAGIVQDPKDYRHCSYAAALGGCQPSRTGIRHHQVATNEEKALQTYRQRIAWTGSEWKTRKGKPMSHKQIQDLLREKGQLSSAEALRLRIRYFSDGLVLGSELYLEKIFRQYRQHFSTKRKRRPQKLRRLPWSQLQVARRLRRKAIG